MLIFEKYLINICCHYSGVSQYFINNVFMRHLEDSVNSQKLIINFCSSIFSLFPNKYFSTMLGVFLMVQYVVIKLLRQTKRQIMLKPSLYWLSVFCMHSNYVIILLKNVVLWRAFWFTSHKTTGNRSFTVYGSGKQMKLYLFF